MLAWLVAAALSEMAGISSLPDARTYLFDLHNLQY